MNTPDRILDAARRHPFYRGTLDGVRRFEDCPILEKPALDEGVREVLRDPGSRRGLYLSPTGGTTTGRSISFPTTIRENRRQRASMARRLEAAGMLGAASIALNLFPCGQLCRSLAIFDDYCERCGATTLPVGAHAADEEAWAAGDRFGATTLMGMPSRLIAFARWMEARGRTLPLDSVLFAGELLHAPKRQLLERALGVRRFGGVYGSAEMGVVAYQPDVGEPPVYRFPRDLVHVEIPEPDGEGFGRLVVTNLVRTLHPLLRYDTGDVGRLAGGTADEAWVELRGRDGDSFAIGDDYFHLREFSPVLGRFAQSQVVLAFDEGAGMDRITFRLVADGPVPDVLRGELEASLRSLLEADDRSYRTDVAFVPPEALVRRPGTLKVPAIVDLRGRGEDS